MRRLGLQNKPSLQLRQKWDASNRKLGRVKGLGIDQYRYQLVILLLKLFLFAKEYMAKQLEIDIQEDKAPAYNYYVQRYIYNLHKIQKILQCSNLPDLNAIEPCWLQMKRYTIKQGAPKSRVEVIRVQEQCQKNLPQEKIQAQVERIPVHIQKIIELEGRNEYKAGRNTGRYRLRKDY